MRQLLLALTAIAAPVVSQGAEVHVHGEGLLQLAEADGSVEVILRIPALDLVGFEHLPSSPAEHISVHQGAMLLMDAARVLKLPHAAGCQVQVSNVGSLLLDHVQLDVIEAALDARGNDRDPGSDAQRDQDADAGHGSPDAHRHTEQTASAGHADFSATYSFACQNPAALRAVDVTLFQSLSGLHAIEVEAMTSHAQGLGQATPGSPQVSW